MTEITRAPAARIGVDLSKRVFQVHAVDRWGKVVLAKAMSPDRFFAWCAALRRAWSKDPRLRRCPRPSLSSTPHAGVAESPRLVTTLFVAVTGHPTAPRVDPQTSRCGYSRVQIGACKAGLERRRW
jgi:hypothetical protein